MRTRTIVDADVGSVLAVLDAAYGPNRGFPTRLARYRTLEPEGWIVAEDEDGIAGTAGFLCFGPCAYIGLMAVAPARQRRGIGALLFEELLRRCERRGQALLLLDASAAGAPLYARYGFVDHGLVHGVALGANDSVAAEARLPDGVSVEPLAASDGELVAAVAAFDAAGFGAPRTALVTRLIEDNPRRAFVARDRTGGVVGYAVGQARSVGPCMAVSPDIAQVLLRSAATLSYPATPTCFVSEGASADCVLRAGGVVQRSWRHMRRGDAHALRADWARVYAKASLAEG